MNRKPVCLLVGITFWLCVIAALAKMMQGIGNQ
jgi:hypothetical protein